MLRVKKGADRFSEGQRSSCLVGVSLLHRSAIVGVWELWGRGHFKDILRVRVVVLLDRGCRSRARASD